MSIVICKLPNAGLGNQLFPLMKAHTFGALNNMPVVVTHYNQIKIGPYLRKDKSKRKYRGYFVFEKGWFSEQLDKWRINRYTANQEKEPVVRILSEKTPFASYLFEEIPHWSDYFRDIKDHRQLVIQLFNKLLSPQIIEEVSKQEPVCIGVHIRMGDFRKLQKGEDFSKVGAVRTPETYFIEVINNIRSIHGSVLPVSVFTDGYRSEFQALFSLENVSLVEGNKDIVDMLLLSKSKIIVCSAGSTFSYWAGFLSDSPIIVHPDHVHQTIRPENMGSYIYEGPLSYSSSVLTSNIKSIEYPHEN